MKEYPTMDEMIEDCKKKQKPTEEIVFAVGAGRVLPMIGKTKAIKKTMDYIQKMDGFIGIYPMDLWHTLLVFDTLNNAKGARNTLKAKGVGIGQVVPILVEKEYIRESENV